MEREWSLAMVWIGAKKKKLKTPQSVFYSAFPHRGLKSTKLVARKLKKWFSIDSRFAHHRPFKLDVRREKIANLDLR